MLLAAFSWTSKAMETPHSSPSPSKQPKRKERQRQREREGQAASCKGLLMLWAWLSYGLNCSAVGKFFQQCLGYWFNMCAFPSCLHREQGCFNRPAPLAGNKPSLSAPHCRVGLSRLIAEAQFWQCTGAFISTIPLCLWHKEEVACSWKESDKKEIKARGEEGRGNYLSWI